MLLVLVSKSILLCSVMNESESCTCMLVLGEPKDPIYTTISIQWYLTCICQLWDGLSPTWPTGLAETNFSGKRWDYLSSCSYPMCYSAKEWFNLKTCTHVFTWWSASFLCVTDLKPWEPLLNRNICINQLTLMCASKGADLAQAKAILKDLLVYNMSCSGSG